MNLFVDENHIKHDGAEVILLSCGEKYVGKNWICGE